MKNVPNILTFIRLLLIPFYFMVFYSDSGNARTWALVIFVTASVTDVLDGYLARKYHVTSKFGAVADPFADKLMQLSVLYTLADVGIIENWFFWLILIKEALQIIGGSAIYSRKPNAIMPANFFGKATTVLIFVTILIAFLELPTRHILQQTVAVFAILTFIQYAYHILNNLFIKNRS